jgi:tol-pal system protein YbgF
MPILSRTVTAFALASLCIGAASILARAESLWPDVGPSLATNGEKPTQYAQGYGLPPADLGGGDTPYSRPEPDSASLLLRVDRLESQLRHINGQIEQLQFEFRRLTTQLEKFQQDVDFRFQENRGERNSPGRPPQKRTEAPEFDPSVRTAEPEPGLSEPRATRRGDAFDPATDPSAPGAPRMLGRQAARGPSEAAGGSFANPDADDIDAPLDLTGGRARSGMTHPSAGFVESANTSGSEFDMGVGQLRQRQYDSAERSFTAFLANSPNDKLASDATYYLGESYFQRGRQREAAEQYLKVSTRYGTSARAPEALLRLGQSLNALGAKEQACAAYAEIARKYPNATPAVKSGAQREARRSRC